MSRKKSKLPPGNWYPLYNRMVRSEPFKRLTLWDKAAFLEFLGQYNHKKPNSMSVAYSEVRHIFKNRKQWTLSKFRIRAYGVLRLVKAGGFGRNPTVMGVCGRWESLNRRPKKLAQVDRLLRHYERIRRIPLKNIRGTTSHSNITPSFRKQAALHKIEQDIFKR